MIVRHNIMAANVGRALTSNQNESMKSMEKLSSGYAVNRAGDDAAGLAISEKMRGRLTGIRQCQRNVEDGISLVDTIDGALEEYHSILQRMRSLAEQSSNGVYEPLDRNMIQQEFSSLTDELDRIALSTKFDKVDCLAAVVEKEAAVETVPASLDIVFVLDRTGSMGSKINNVKNNLNHFVASMEGVKLRLGIVDYTDGQSPEVRNYGFFTDQELFKNKLAELASHTPGGTENGLDAIEEALTMDFSEGATKHIILLGDEVITSRGNVNSTAKVKADLEDAGVTFTLIGNSVVKDQLAGAGILKEDKYMEITSNFAEGLKKLGEDIVSELPDVPDVEENYYPDPEDVILKIGPDYKEELVIKLKCFRPQRWDLDKISCQTLYDAQQALEVIDKAITETSSHRGSMGAYRNRLEHTRNSLAAGERNLQEAESRIRDTDIARENMKLVKSNLLIQSSQNMLFQAQMQPERVLSLLQ